MSNKRLGVLVGGGPAPGINAVIGAATIEAVNRGLDVIGFYDGLQWLAGDEFDAAVHATPLDIATVTRIHFDGGSILRTSRRNLLDERKLNASSTIEPDATKVQRVIGNLRNLNVEYLVIIGGDDTSLSARFIAEAAADAMRVVHVPKTIDNDLPLPYDIPTFGFSSARYHGTKIVKNLMQDSKTTGRWYLVTAMGRSAGWLALAIGQAAGATLSLIPEEFGEQITLESIANVIDGAMLKRRVMGRPDGVAVVAEGLAYRLGDRAELQRMLGREVPVDAAGHPRLAEVPLGDLLRNELQNRFEARGKKLTIISHTLGYELRSADPTPADMSYCRSLGHGSIRLLLDERNVSSGVMVTLVNGNLVPMDFRDLIDPHTQRTRIRHVNVKSDNYRTARAYMIRLERGDLNNPETLAKLAAEANLSPEEFRRTYLQAATRMVDGLPADSAPTDSIA
ncbi:MAG: 6-phosphofructokinase [Planctomycetes bacterium]|nr:6-phosphofructokinase [Planctomycetota bacterium]